MKLQGSRVFVTGGAGFIGSHIVDSLVTAGAEVTVYDDFSSGSRDNLKSVERHIRTVEGDVRDVDRLTSAMKGAEVVSHQAAQLEITKCIQDPVADLTSNTIGTLNVLSACVQNGVHKLINASSACVYGQAESIPEVEDTHPTNPNWAYGVSKLAAEKYTRIYSELHHLPSVSFRYGIVYGPREWYGRVLTIFLKRAVEGKSLIVFGDGSQQRDFTYVGDLVRMHNICLEAEEANGHVFNVSTGIATPIRQLAATVQRVTGGRVVIEHEDVKPGESSERIDRVRLPSELQAMVLSPAKARDLVGWEPAVALEEGLRIECEWLWENAERWARMSY